MELQGLVIHCLRLLLQEHICVAAPTAFNIERHTLHSLLSLPTKRDFKNLEGDRLHQLQQSMSTVKYLIINEMSMVERKLLGQVDRCLRQVFPHHLREVFKGCSCLLFGDYGQPSPEIDLPLYTNHSHSELSDQGRAAYQSSSKAIILNLIMRQIGNGPSQVQFQNILLCLQDGKATVAD